MISGEKEDLYLLNQVLDGDKKSEEKLYNKYKNILSSYLNKKYQSTEIPDDVSEILIKVFLNIRDFDPKKAKFSTWVFSVTKNHMIDKSKSKYINNISNHHSIPSTITHSIDIDLNTFDNSNDNYNTTNSFEITNAVNYISDSISTGDFTLLNMHYSQGYSYCEIATEFNMTSNTVSNKVNYIKSKVKNIVSSNILE